MSAAVKHSFAGLRNFRLLFIASSISYFGNSIQFVTRGWLALEITGQASAVGWVFALSMIPNVLLSPFVGVLVDRLSRKHLAACIDLFRALVLALMAILFYEGYGNIAALYTMTFLLSIGDSVYAMLSPALSKDIIPEEDLLPGNSWIASWNQIGAVIGVGLGGLLLGWFSEWQVFVINMFTFLISWLLISKMRMVSVRGEGTQRKHFFREMQDGMRYASEHRYIVFPYSVLTCYNFTIRTLNVLLGVFILEVLHKGVIAFGLIDAAFAVGAILGNVLLVRLSKHYGFERVLMIGLFGLGLAVFAFSQSSSLVLCVAIYGVIGIMYQSRVLVVTESQRLVHSGVLGRVQSLFFAFDSMLAFLSFICISHLSDVISPKWLYLLPVTLLLIATLAAGLRNGRMARIEIEKHQRM